MEIVAEKYGCEKLCVCCYHNLLEDVLGYPRFDCAFTKSVKQVASEYDNNTLIIRIDSHLTASINGIVKDIWDCTDDLVDCFWIVA